MCSNLVVTFADIRLPNPGQGRNLDRYVCFMHTRILARKEKWHVCAFRSHLGARSTIEFSALKPNTMLYANIYPAKVFTLDHVSYAAVVMHDDKNKTYTMFSKASRRTHILTIS